MMWNEETLWKSGQQEYFLTVVVAEACDTLTVYSFFYYPV